MVHMHIVKHNCILGSVFTNTKTQLHVSAINVGHLQVVQRNLSISYIKVCGEFTVCGVGWVRDIVCVGERGVDWGCFGNCVKVTSSLLTAMSRGGLHIDIYNDTLK